MIENPDHRVRMFQREICWDCLGEKRNYKQNQQPVGRMQEKTLLFVA